MKRTFFSGPNGSWQEQAGDLPLRRRSQRGAGLIEVLVAVVILAIGLLGMAGMTASSIKFNQMSRMRGTGVLLVNDLAERARVNALGFDAGGYASAAGKNYSFSPTLMSESGCFDLVDNKCTPEQMAAYDMNQWLRNVNARLPGGDAFIQTSSAKEARAMDIWLMWTEATESTNINADDDSANTSNMSQTCPTSVLPEGEDTSGVRCMYFMVTL
ncbi:MAG: type IV pilus modification protein PilV [Brachymonas sp.]